MDNDKVASDDITSQVLATYKGRPIRGVKVSGELPFLADATVTCAACGRPAPMASGLSMAIEETERHFRAVHPTRPDHPPTPATLLPEQVRVPSLSLLRPTWAILLSDPEQRKRAADAIIRALFLNSGLIQFGSTATRLRVEAALDLLSKLPQNADPKHWYYNPIEQDWHGLSPEEQEDYAAPASSSDKQILNRKESTMLTTTTDELGQGLSVRRVHGTKKLTLSRIVSDQRDSWKETLNLSDEEFDAIAASVQRMRGLDQPPLPKATSSYAPEHLLKRDGPSEGNDTPGYSGTR